MPLRTNVESEDIPAITESAVVRRYPSLAAMVDAKQNGVEAANAIPANSNCGPSRSHAEVCGADALVFQ